jgi:hypothetical protein
MNRAGKAVAVAVVRPKMRVTYSGEARAKGRRTTRDEMAPGWQRQWQRQCGAAEDVVEVSQ